jgi:hypothetical protein
MDSFPDIRMMTRLELETYFTSLQQDDAKIAGLDEPSAPYQRRIIRGKLELVDAEIARR